MLPKSARSQIEHGNRERIQQRPQNSQPQQAQAAQHNTVVEHHRSASVEHGVPEVTRNRSIRSSRESRSARSVRQVITSAPLPHASAKPIGRLRASAMLRTTLEVFGPSGSSVALPNMFRTRPTYPSGMPRGYWISTEPEAASSGSTVKMKS